MVGLDPLCGFRRRFSCSLSTKAAAAADVPFLVVIAALMAACVAMKAVAIAMSRIVHAGVLNVWRDDDEALVNQDCRCRGEAYQGGIEDQPPASIDHHDLTATWQRGIVDRQCDVVDRQDE